ncbi:MAG: MFS transporter [Patescibacteria group bacterium]
MNTETNTRRFFFWGDLLKANPVIKFLIFGDVVFFSAAGLLGPIFALFVVDFIQGGSAEVAGIAIAIYLITKSLFQIPAAALIDKICGDKDDFWFIFGSLIFASFIPLSYLFISTPFELYVAQFLLGLAFAFQFPSFMALFTKYIPDSKEATMWGLYFTMLDLASAATAALGGYLAITFGFQSVILAVSVFELIGAFMFVPIYKHIKRNPVC